MTASHRFIEANGIRFHYVEEGEGPLVLLLHGFPECWYSWRKQLPVLAAAGYRAVAPDMRGYNLTDKPKSGYNIESLVDDVEALAHALGESQIHLVGHDWGAIVAWQVAWRKPELLRSLTIMNVPHPTAFARYLRSHPRQMLKSIYMLLFQIPRLPERVLTRNRAAAIGRAFRDAAGHPDAFSDADVDVYREAFLRPGVARSSLNYYRQAIRQGLGVLPDSPIRVPTLVLWGEDDPVLEQALNDDLGRWVDDFTFKPIPGCGHWTQQEAPEIVNTELLAWLKAHNGAPKGI